jgi:alpha-tubulin suppressor-like RCC1 family protein
MHEAAQRTQNAEKMGHLQQICCGRDHTLNLTRDGDVFSYGSGTFSAAGHGGSKEALSPMILKPLRDKRVVKIACGESHSLILTDKADVYAWGRGFEGQLGLSKSIEVASTPQYIKAFYGSPVQSIEAGAYFSLAITRDGNLYGWGEAKMGQLGLGKQREVRIPQRIPIIEEASKQEHRVVSCSAGFGHTACLTESGDLYTWGFNIYGQLGLGDRKTRWYPEKVSRDISGHNLARQIKVKCSNYAAFSIDEYGHPYSWGKGHVGHSGNCILDLPKMIETNTDNRIFTDMYANDDSILFYAPIRVYNISP